MERPVQHSTEVLLYMRVANLQSTGERETGEVKHLESAESAVALGTAFVVDFELVTGCAGRRRERNGETRKVCA